MKIKIFRYLKVTLLVLTTLLLVGNVQAGFGVKYGNEFLEFGTGARENSLGGAVISNPDPVVAAYWNPAALTQTEVMTAQIMHTEEFAGIVKNDQLFVNIPSTNINWSVGLFRTGVDEIPNTQNVLIEYGPDNDTLDENDRLDYSKISYFNASESAFFISGGKKLNSKLSIGGSFKTIHKNYFEKYSWGFGIDLGLIYQPFDNLSLGGSVRDITTTYLFWKDGKKEVVAPSLKLGGSYLLDPNFLSLKFKPMLGMDTNFEGKQNQTDLSMGFTNLRFRGGLEIIYNNLISFRTGRDDIGGLHIGCGLNTDYGTLDYGFAFGGSYSELKNSHQVALSFYIKKLWSELR